MADDPVYLNRPGLFISRSRLIVHGRAYSVQHIVSVWVDNAPRPSTGADVALVWGIILSLLLFTLILSWVATLSWRPMHQLLVFAALGLPGPPLFIWAVRQPRPPRRYIVCMELSNLRRWT